MERLAEVGVIESVEHLNSEAERGTFIYLVKREALGDGDVSVRVAGTKDLVSLLLAEVRCGGDVSGGSAGVAVGGAVAGALGWQVCDGLPGEERDRGA